jgi:hypothetical protein
MQGWDKSEKIERDSSKQANITEKMSSIRREWEDDDYSE